MIAISKFDDEVVFGLRNSLSFLLMVLVLLTTFLGVQPCFAQSDPDMLRFIADGYEANIEKLRTWKGTAIRQGARKTPEPADVSIPSKIEEEWAEQIKFVSDRDRNATLWYGKPTEGQSPLSVVSSGMNKGEYNYKMDFSNKPEFSQEPRTLRIYSLGTSVHGIQINEFDPVWILVQDVGLDGNMGKNLRSWAKFIEEEPMPERGYKLTRQGDIITLELFAPDNNSETGGMVTSRYLFDLTKGCSVVEQEHISSRSETHWKLDYEKQGGVFVPKEITRAYKDKLKGGDTYRHVTITTEMVNKPISQSEFEYEALGLRPGDYIVDHVKGGLRYKWRQDFGIDEALQTLNSDDEILDNKGTTLQPSGNETKAPNIKQNEQAIQPAIETHAMAQSRQEGQKIIDYLLWSLAILTIIVIGVFLFKQKLNITKRAS